MHRGLQTHEQTSTRAPALIGIVFFISGFATLVYQIAWQRLLTVYYGVGPVSIAVIVSVFLLGLGIGGLAGGWMAERIRRVALLYSALEVGLGLYGIASVPFLDLLGRATAGSSYVWTALFSALFLLPPTVLMGATLPIILKLYNRHSGQYLQSLSFLYFINTLGAATGALVASYALISLFGLDGVIRTAVLLNFVLAFLVLLTMRTTDLAEAVPHARVPARELLGQAAIWLVFITGFIAIGYEIAWTLSISNILKSSPYMFSTILFVYLTGIALGSFGMNRLGRLLSVTQCRSLFFLLQVLIAITASLPVVFFKTLVGDHSPLQALYAITAGSEMHPPYLEFAAGWDHFWQTWGSPEKLFLLLDIFFWPFLFMFIPTVLIGASFPLVAYLANANEDREAQATGVVYFINVLGNVVGCLVTGFILLPYLGSEPTFLVLALLGLAFGLGISRLGRVHIPLVLRGIAVAAVATGLILKFPPHGELIYWPPSVLAKASERNFDEGQSGIVTGNLLPGYFFITMNGLRHGGRDGVGFGEGWGAYYIQAYGALRSVASVDDVLIIGFGTGSNAEAVLTDNDVKRLTIVEINETAVKNLRRQKIFRDIFDAPRVRLVTDDARRLLYREETKYDVVMMDPLRPTTVYSNNVYSTEFFDLIKRRLKPGGVVIAWVERDELRNTIAAVFPYVRQECGIFLLASERPIQDYRDVEAIIRTNLPEAGQKSIADRRKLCPPEDRDIAFVPTVPVLTDKRPLLEYHLGRY